MKRFTTKSGRTITIRIARTSDAAAVIECLNAAGGESDYLTFGKDGFTKTIEQEERYLDEATREPNRLVLGALDDEHLIGILTIDAKGKDRIRHIGDLGMFIRRSHWSDGIGAALLATAIEWAFETRLIRKINLLVRTDNERAIALYETFGFEHEGTIKRDACIDGTFYDSYAMGLLIDPDAVNH